MRKKGLFEKCVEAINDEHVLLVYPLENRPQPRSLWHALYPKTEMRWEWDADGDHRVAGLWRVREQLSQSGLVLYSKWYRGRATFFSQKAFSHLLILTNAFGTEDQLRGEAGTLYDLLTESSPRSTKELKLHARLRGKIFESTYQRAMKKLFDNGLIVGWGEVDDGAFPSLASGATKFLFEELWENAKSGNAAASQKWWDKNVAESFRLYLEKTLHPKENKKSLKISL